MNIRVDSVTRGAKALNVFLGATINMISKEKTTKAWKSVRGIPVFFVRGVFHRGADKKWNGPRNWQFHGSSFMLAFYIELMDFSPMSCLSLHASMKAEPP